MRKSVTVLLVTMSMMTGCVSSAVKDKISVGTAKMDGYVRQMDAGETTREEDQDLIRAIRIITWEMNKLTNGETPPDDIRLIIEARLRARGE